MFEHLVKHLGDQGSIVAKRTTSECSEHYRIVTVYECSPGNGTNAIHVVVPQAFVPGHQEGCFAPFSLSHAKVLSSFPNEC